MSDDEQTLYEVYEDSLLALDLASGDWQEVTHQYGVERWGVFFGAEHDVVVAEEDGASTLYLVQSRTVIAQQTEAISFADAAVSPLGDLLVTPVGDALRVFSLDSLDSRDIPLPVGLPVASGWLSGADTLLLATVPEDEDDVGQALTLHALDIVDGTTRSHALGPTAPGTPGLMAWMTAAPESLVRAAPDRPVVAVPARSFYDGRPELRLVDVTTGAVATTAGVSAAWLPDGRSLVTGRDDGLYRAQLDGASTLLDRGASPVWLLFPDGLTVVADYATDTQDLHILRLDTGERLVTHWGDSLTKVAVRGAELFMLDADANLMRLDTTTGEVIDTLLDTYRIAYLPEADVLLLDGKPGSIRVVDPDTLTVVETLWVNL